MTLVGIATLKKVGHPQNIMLDVSKFGAKIGHIHTGEYYINCEHNRKLMMRAMKAIDSWGEPGELACKILKLRYQKYMDVASIAEQLGISAADEREIRYSALKTMAICFKENGGKKSPIATLQVFDK